MSEDDDGSDDTASWLDFEESKKEELRREEEKRKKEKQKQRRDEWKRKEENEAVMIQARAEVLTCRYNHNQ